LVEIMERVCTEAELDALELKAIGYGTRSIATQLGIGRRALRDRLQSAERKILQEVAAMRGVV
jgi:DNA-binding CsgD family transcriptional regulator